MANTADLTFWVSFSAGIASFFSPCVLPLIPSYLSYITGLSFGQLNSEHPTAKVRLTIFLHSLAFVLGFSIVFVGLGALAGAASANIMEKLSWLQKVGGLLIFLFGLHLSGIFRFRFLLGEKRVHVHHKPHGFLGSLVVGLAFAAGWTPCIGPILGSILTLAATEGGGVTRSTWLLAVYSIGLGIPFLAAGVLFHSFINFFNKARRYIRIIEIFTGALLMIAGVLLFFDQFGKLTSYMYRIFPLS